MTTDQEFAEYLRSFPRELSAAEVEELGRQHDAEQGPYIPHSGVHHTAGDAAH
jgi:hypothetical protein